MTAALVPWPCDSPAHPAPTRVPGRDRLNANCAGRSAQSHLRRIPELICGFGSRPGEGPTLCESRIYLHYTALPEDFRQLRIRDLRVGSASVDLTFERDGENVGVDIPRRNGEVEIVCLR